MTREIALDLETMSTEPNAAITAIGMVEFHRDEDRIDREFYMPVHLATSVAAGGVMDPATVLWWMGEDLVEARRKMLFSAAPIEVALEEAKNWIINACMGADVIVWANSPAFDCVILKSAMERSGIRPPWDFRNERCVRTLRKLYPSIADPEPEAGRELKHFALDDARWEARVVMNIWQKLHG